MCAKLSGYAPLQNFNWNGADIDLAPGLSIRRMPEPEEASALQASTAQWYWDRARESRHWLVYETDAEGATSIKDIEHLVLLALWLRRPSRTHIGYRFEIEQKDDGNTRTSSARLNDTFAWIGGLEDRAFEDEDLAAASTLFQRLLKIYTTQGRLSSAVVMTITGCWSHSWQSAFIIHAAAIESLLTYSTDRGLTRRLAKSYACLIEADTRARDAAFMEFMNLYDARSDIVHGRAHEIIGAQNRRETLTRFQAILRSIWLRVLADAQLIGELERDDARREGYFTALQQGYVPPQI